MIHWSVSYDNQSLVHCLNVSISEKAYYYSILHWVVKIMALYPIFMMAVSVLNCWYSLIFLFFERLTPKEVDKDKSDGSFKATRVRSSKRIKSAKSAPTAVTIQPTSEPDRKKSKLQTSRINRQGPKDYMKTSSELNIDQQIYLFLW